MHADNRSQTLNTLVCERLSRADCSDGCSEPPYMAALRGAAPNGRLCELLSLFVFCLFVCAARAHKKSRGHSLLRVTPAWIGGGYLLSHFRSTIGAAGFNFSVRNGKRWNPRAMAALVSLSASAGWLVEWRCCCRRVSPPRLCC